MRLSRYHKALSGYGGSSYTEEARCVSQFVVTKVEGTSGARGNSFSPLLESSAFRTRKVVENVAIKT